MPEKKVVTATEVDESSGFHVLEIHAPTAGLSVFSVVLALIGAIIALALYRRCRGKKRARKEVTHVGYTSGGPQVDLMAPPPTRPPVRLEPNPAGGWTDFLPAVLRAQIQESAWVSEQPAAPGFNAMPALPAPRADWSAQARLEHGERHGDFREQYRADTGVRWQDRPERAHEEMMARTKYWPTDDDKRVIAEAVNFREGWSTPHRGRSSHPAARRTGRLPQGHGRGRVVAAFDQGGPQAYHGPPASVHYGANGTATTSAGPQPSRFEEYCSSDSEGQSRAVALYQPSRADRRQQESDQLAREQAAAQAERLERVLQAAEGREQQVLATAACSAPPLGQVGPFNPQGPHALTGEVTAADIRAAAPKGVTTREQGSSTPLTNA